MQQNRKNAKGDEYFCKALYCEFVKIVFVFEFFVVLSKLRETCLVYGCTFGRRLGNAARFPK